MKKGYYWIPEPDMSLNGMEYFEAKIAGESKIDIKNNYVEFRLTRHFPVGSIFHFMHNKVEYVIYERVKTWGLKYRARRADGCKISWEDVGRFGSGRNVYRTGEMN